MNWTIEPVERLEGTIIVPGDKSISHRSLLLAAIAGEDSHLEGLSDGADVDATRQAVRALGVAVSEQGGGLRIAGAGIEGLREASAALNCGNSGTTMRLIVGLLAGQPFATRLVGDASLQRRPMRRIAEPLQAMGAAVETSSRGTAPLRIVGRRPLRAISYRPEVASAQVKSCVLIAGLYADGTTTVEEPAPTRDHSERLLAAMGAAMTSEPLDGGRRVRVRAAERLAPLHGRVPGDASSAAYWVAAAALIEGSDLRLPGVGLNPGRTAFFELLRSWGAAIEMEPGEDWHGEPTGCIRARGGAARLSGGTVEAAAVPGLIDELPLLAALGPLTDDGVEIRGAAELRVKESDRIATIAAALRALGAEVDEFPDGLAVRGGRRLRSGTVDAGGDHRIALAMGTVGLAADGPVTVANAEAMSVSYPRFARHLAEVAR